MVQRKVFYVVTVAGATGYMALMVYLYGTHGNGCFEYPLDSKHVVMPVSIAGSGRLQQKVFMNASTIDLRRLEGDDMWVPVSNVHRLFVYAAYYDSSLPDRIRVIGVMPTFNRVRPWCLVTTGNSTVRTRADIVNINEEHGKRYTAAFFLCYVCGTSNVPDTVSVVGDDDLPSHALRVHVIPTSNRTRRHEFTVCLSPFNNLYNNTEQLIEWVEMNILLGGTFFTFYNFSASRRVQNVLQYYASIGFADVLQWNIDTIDRALLEDHDGSHQSIHYYGQLAAINDCLYRNKRLARYLAIVDVDEFIVPRNSHDYTWMDMFARLPDASVYMFRNTFFHKHVSSNRTKNQTLNVLNTPYRGEIYAVGDRSKVMVRTSDVVTLGIHDIWSLESESGGKYAVPPSIGLLHHYRREPLNTSRSKLVEDKTMYKYDTLKQKVYVAKREMNDKGYTIA